MTAREPAPAVGGERARNREGERGREKERGETRARKGVRRSEMLRVDARGCGRDVLQGLAGTTMHLIINSLDTRRWMSDGVSPGAWRARVQGMVCCRSSVGGGG